MLNESDNFEEDITLSPCGDCKWKNSEKCNRCVNRNRINPIKYWSPYEYPFSPKTILTTCNGADDPKQIPNNQD